MDFETGQIVFSKCGHDNTLPFIVTAVDGEYLYLADGKSRRLDHPKRKKIKHVQGTKYVCTDIKKKLEDKSYILDADILKAIKEYCREM